MDSRTPDELIQFLCRDQACNGKGTYTVKAVCNNCDWKGSLELTKGHEFNRWNPCPNCGCTYTLMRRSS